MLLFRFITHGFPLLFPLSFSLVLVTPALTTSLLNLLLFASQVKCPRVSRSFPPELSCFPLPSFLSSGLALPSSRAQRDPSTGSWAVPAVGNF